MEKSGSVVVVITGALVTVTQLKLCFWLALPYDTSNLVRGWRETHLCKAIITIT